MFGKLFGKSKPQVSPEEQKKIEQEQLNLKLQQSSKFNREAMEKYDK